MELIIDIGQSFVALYLLVFGLFLIKENPNAPRGRGHNIHAIVIGTTIATLAILFFRDYVWS